MKIGILGIGAIGSFAACMLQDNHQLTYYGRSPKNMIDFQSLGKQYLLDINLSTLPSACYDSRLDWLIICLKENHFATAKPWFENLIHDNVKIAVIRNGLNHSKPLLPYTRIQNILECIIDCSIEPNENGGYIQKKSGIISVADSILALEFKSLFVQNFCNVKLVSDFKSVAWKKLIESAAIGGITALLQKPISVLRVEENMKIFIRLLEEGVEVAVSDGAIIENSFVENIVAKLSSYPQDKGSSMLTDQRLGRPIEINAKNGCISHFGKLYQVPTPTQDWIVDKLSSFS